ncbi:DEAD/DEAH box helicase [Phycicoccus elongatus]|uniref:DEAD/DEAH box helicase n=1 Tax=Phycicoccus elongatus TaxID=101689 RepID=UPI002C26250A|nr:DEAD/DEAH box helicase [Phycicoccus elongatus]HPQ72361.1 DEAD/DEAH box helicase [Phycicoccus elongatus]
MGIDVASANWLAGFTPDIGRETLGDAAWERGFAYAAAGNVLSITSADRGRMLLAEVAGSRDWPYQTLVTATAGAAAEGLRGLLDRGQHPWTSRCSCPVRSECKHVAAVLAAAVAARAAGSEASGPAPDWESVLAPMLDGPRATDGEHLPLGGHPLGLIVDLVTRPGPPPARLPARRVVLQATRQLIGGQWAKRLPWNEIGDALRHPAVPAQREALVALHRLGSAHLPVYSQLSLTELRLDQLGGDGWAILHRAVRAGVELVGPRGSGLEVTLEPDDAQIALVITGEDDLSVTVDLGDDVFPERAERGLIGAPAHGLWAMWTEGATRRLALRGFDRPLPDTLRSVALDHVPLHVPAADAERFRRLFLPRLGGAIRIRSGDGNVDSLRDATPVLVVDVRTNATNGLDLDLALAYDLGGDVLVRLDDPAAGTLRDAAAERRLLAALDLLDALPGSRQRGMQNGHWWLAKVHHSLSAVESARFALDVLPDLETHPQVRVLIHGELPAYQEVTEAPTIEIGADDGDNDWLDLRITVRVDDQEVPFEPLFQALVRGDEAMVLDSGTWFRLDHPDLIRLRDLIGEARELDDRPPRDGARLNRFQVSLWDELADLGELSGGAAWQERVEALASLDLADRPIPIGLKATLRPYQVSGFQWLATLWEARLGGVLADDMGLGKTLQALALVLHAKDRGELDHPFLVVAPTSVLETWRGEAERFAPDLRVVLLGETERRRGVAISKSVAGADLVVTSYAVARIDDVAIASVPWAGVVLDEAQFVKNPRSKGHAAIRRLRAPFVLAVTGTPLENSLMDLWSLLALAAPGLYPRADTFSAVYRRPIESGREPELLDRLRTRIRPLMLRRTKSEVAADLPEKQVQVLDIAMNPQHERIYSRQLQRERQRVLGLLDDPEANRIAILSSLTRLRQLSLDPALVDDEHAEVGSAKIDALVEHLTELRREGHRALVFSQFTRFLRRVEARLEREGIPTTYLDGTTTNRPDVIRGWRNGDQTAFLISLKAGGFGLTLTEASYVFVLDPWWNPAAEAQAIDRTHRIGQTSKVMVYRLISGGTIEEKVLALQERKRDLFEQVVDDGGALSGAITAEDIKALLRED